MPCVELSILPAASLRPEGRRTSRERGVAAVVATIRVAAVAVVMAEVGLTVMYVVKVAVIQSLAVGNRSTTT